MQKMPIRNWIIYWLYGVAAMHLLIGFLLPWIGNLALLDPYHRSIEAVFWPVNVPAGARGFQVWWISLFGPTIQTLAIWMAALIYVGDRYRSSFVWLCLALGFAVWAPQDIFISLRANAWAHVWVDLSALASVFPPLGWLWWQDRKQIIHK